MPELKTLLGGSAEFGTTLALSGLLNGITRKEVENLKSRLDGTAPDKNTKKIIGDFLKSESIDPNKFKVLKSQDTNGFSMRDKAMVLSTGDKAVALHEAGHAIQSERIPNLSRLGVAISRYTPMALAANAVLAELTDNKTSDVINKYGPGILLASSAPEAALEYDASRRAKAYMKKNFPEEYAESSDKLDAAFGAYIRDAFTGPVAWSTGRLAREMVKGAGLGSMALKGSSLIGRGLGTVARKGTEILGNQARASARAYRDISDARGVVGKGRQAWNHLVGADASTTSGKVAKGLALGGAALSPVLAASEIAKDPGKVSTWTRETARVGGEVLGGGKFLGGAAFGQGAAELGERVGKKIDRFITEPIKRTVSN